MDSVVQMYELTASGVRTLLPAMISSYKAKADFDPLKLPGPKVTILDE